MYSVQEKVGFVCFLSDLFIFILCEFVFFQCKYLCEGVGSLGAGVTDSCELLNRCWELNLCPLEEQPVLLTTELSFQLIGEGDCWFVSFVFCFVLIYIFLRVCCGGTGL